VSCNIVLLVLKAIFTFVCLKILVIFLMCGVVCSVGEGGPFRIAIV